MNRILAPILTLILTVPLGTVASAVQLFGPGDTILAVDIDSGPDSAVPGPGEDAVNALDQNSATKYLNFGKHHTGLIVTPGFGSSTVQSIQFTTANDSDGRDPTSFRLYGTNDAITSVAHSFGDAESWSLITDGLTGLDPARFDPGPIVDFSNGTAYSSYKVSFPTLRNTLECCMQVADVSLFTGAGGSGTQVLASGDFAIAIDDFGGLSNYHPNDNVENAIDGTSGAKYLNFAKENSGVIVSRADGNPTVLETLTFTTANDIPERDPLTWEVYGTNDPVMSLDNSTGSQENWVLIDSGITGFDSDPGRETTGAPQSVTNATAYNAYRLVFPSQRQTDGIGEIQIGEILFEGTIVPEPTSIALALLSVLAIPLLRR